VRQIGSLTYYQHRNHCSVDHNGRGGFSQNAIRIEQRLFCLSSYKDKNTQLESARKILLN
jgi:hypothetical protein